MLAKLRNRIHVAFIVWITLMWCLLMGEFTWANLLGGLAVGTVIVVALPLPAMPLGGLRIRWGQLMLFILQWFVGLLTASAKVAWLAIRRQDPPHTAIIEAPMRVSNEFVLYLATVAYNLQPGGSVTDIDIANRRWTVHLLDVDDADDLQRERDNILTLERRMIRIFEGIDL